MTTTRPALRTVAALTLGGELAAPFATPISVPVARQAFLIVPAD